MIKFNLKQFGIDIRNFSKGERIGKGGFSEVYLTQYRKSEENYAAKILKSSIFKEEERNKIENEINILMSVNHPTIIKYLGYSLLDFCLSPNVVIFTEFAQNGSLSQLISKAKKSDLPENYDNTSRQIILIGVSCGMKYLHHHNIMHRDLKTNNILLDEHYYPHIIDFGMAKYVNNTNLWEKTPLLGTLPYMAPEILLGKKYSYKIDVYSFAMLMYEVIFEEDLYPNLKNKDSITNEIKDYVANSRNRPEFKKEIKNSLKRLIQKCWSHEITDRPNFDDIYNKLTSPEYYLDNVDKDKIKKYIDYITRDDIFTSSNFDLIQKVQSLSKENENLREQIKSLKNENQKLSDYCNQLKKNLDEKLTKTENETQIVIKPPNTKDENLAFNSKRFLHLKEKEANESPLKAYSKQLLTPQKENENQKNPTTRYLNQKNNIENSPRRPIVYRQQKEVKENEVKKDQIENSTKKSVVFPQQKEIKENEIKKDQVENSPRRSILFSSKKETKEDELKFLKPKEKKNDELDNSHKRSILNGQLVLANSSPSAQKRLPQFSKIKNQPNEEVNQVNQTPPIVIKKEEEEEEENQQKNLNEELESKLPTLRKDELVTIFDFNSYSIQQQQQIINSKAISMNSSKSYLRNQFIINLNKFLNYFTQFVKLPNTKDFIEIQTENNDDDKYVNINRSNQLTILYKATEILNNNKLFDSSEFKEIIKLFDHLSIEIKYYSKNFHNAYKTISSMNNVKIKVFISGIRKTDNVFKCNKIIKSVRFDRIVENINEYSFKNCYSLADVVIPETILSIGTGAFEGCYSLKSIKIPSSVTSIECNVFKGCSDLNEVLLPDSIKSIENNAFYGCSSLKEVFIPQSVVSIGDYAFYRCSSLEKIFIPFPVASIGEFAFSKCSALNEISIPSSVNSIGKKAFEGCASLNRVSIPSSIKNVNELDIRAKAIIKIV